MICALVLAGCGGRAYPVARVMDGEERQGVFVSPYAYEHFMRAELAVAAGNDELALEEYALARTGPADDAYVIGRQAAAALRLRRLDEVESLLAEGERLDAASEPIALMRGRLAEHRGEFDGAARHYENAHRYAPNSAQPAQRLAMLLGRSEVAVGILESITEGAERASSLRARLALALFRDDAALAAETALALMRVAPVFATELLATAQTQLDEGRPMMALRLLEHPALETQATTLRLKAFVATGQRDAARGLVLARAGAVSPLRRAEWWWIAGDADLTLVEAQAAIAEGDAEGNYWAGLAAGALGDAAGATRYFARVPESSALHASVAEALATSLRDAGHEAP